MKSKHSELSKAYDFCQQLAESHYENFPVASVFLPKKIRRPIMVIYAFSRTADDFADEGDSRPEVRLSQLNQYSDSLAKIQEGNYKGNDPIFIALADVIGKHSLPIKLFEDLLSAFKQDVIKNRYNNFDEILDYCMRSANPVGRLLLHLNGNPSQQELEQSDAVCTALQLINFYQDIEQDYSEQNRVYIPQDELAALGLQDSDLISKNSLQIAPLIRSLYQRAGEIMQRGYKLGIALNGRMGLEVKSMTLAGTYTLHLLQNQTDDNLLQRPRLHRIDFMRLVLLSLIDKVFTFSMNKYLSNKS